MIVSLQSKEQRSKNLFVTGLPVSQVGSDSEQFIELCSTQLDIVPKVSSTFRLKKKNSDSNSNTSRISPLLVTLESADDAALILKWARELRNSTSSQVRDHIFINRHLTKAEALAAYNERVRRRLKNQGGSSSTNINDPNMDTASSEGALQRSSDQPSTPDKGDPNSQRTNKA